MVAFASPPSSAGAFAPSAGASALTSSAAGPSAPKPEGSTSAASRDEATEASAYGRAHGAHFASDDPARALGLWDAYLRGFPAGVFVPEARFNRALCLLRLGRREAALAALRPFADGAFGGYRAREARTLIDWTALPAGTNDPGAAR
jgi:TolA-binding protein